MSGRQETIRLFRSFLVLRHQYPNKQGRSKLRRWTNLCFSLKQLQYDRIAEQRGAPVADKEAAKWRVQADNHLGTICGPSHPLSNTIASYKICAHKF